MSRSRKSAVYAGLVVLTLWPAVHIYLVKRFDLSPWKLAGWGMYSAPRIGMLGMEVYGRRDGQEAFEKLTVPPPEVRVPATEFLERYRWLRQLTRPDAFARSVLQHQPQWHQLRVEVFQPVLDRQTGMIVLTTVVYEYPK